MKLRTLFVILVALLIAAGVMLIKVSASIDSRMLYLSEGFLLLCAGFCIYFYLKVIRTINALANGMDLLKEKDFSSRLTPVGQHDADRIVDVFNRMMSQLKTERLRLREQNHLLDLIVQTSPMGVVIMDFDGKITSANGSAVRFLGYTADADILGRKMTELSSPLAMRLNAVEQGMTETLRIGDAMIYRCSRLSFVDRGFHHPFILIESLTSEVMKAEKKAYEKVIRMIAHEVNNSVAGVTSAMESVEESLPTTGCDADLREIMQVCVERCHSMSRFITRFADVVKIPEPILRRENINDCVTRCSLFMETMGNDRDISLTLNLSPEPLDVMLDASLIEHALVNIIKNSVESIGRGGHITVTTRRETVPVVEIADDGKGIDSDTADRLFTPFFSTKPDGQGLGLIFIREVLMKHNCLFSLRTYDDGITRFIIRFPDGKCP